MPRLQTDNGLPAESPGVMDGGGACAALSCEGRVTSIPTGNTEKVSHDRDRGGRSGSFNMQNRLGHCIPGVDNPRETPLTRCGMKRTLSPSTVLFLGSTLYAPSSLQAPPQRRDEMKSRCTLDPALGRPGHPARGVGLVGAAERCQFSCGRIIWTLSRAIRASSWNTTPSIPAWEAASAA